MFSKKLNYNKNLKPFDGIFFRTTKTTKPLSLLPITSKSVGLSKMNVEHFVNPSKFLYYHFHSNTVFSLRKSVYFLKKTLETLQFAASTSTIENKFENIIYHAVSADRETGEAHSSNQIISRIGTMYGTHLNAKDKAYLREAMALAIHNFFCKAELEMAFRDIRTHINDMRVLNLNGEKFDVNGYGSFTPMVREFMTMYYIKTEIMPKLEVKLYKLLVKGSINISFNHGKKIPYGNSNFTKNPCPDSVISFKNKITGEICVIGIDFKDESKTKSAIYANAGQIITVSGPKKFGYSLLNQNIQQIEYFINNNLKQVEPATAKLIRDELNIILIEMKQLLNSNLSPVALQKELEVYDISVIFRLRLLKVNLLQDNFSVFSELRYTTLMPDPGKTMLGVWAREYLNNKDYYILNKKQINPVSELLENIYHLRVIPVGTDNITIQTAANFVEFTNRVIDDPRGLTTEQTDQAITRHTLLQKERLNGEIKQTKSLTRGDDFIAPSDVVKSRSNIFCIASKYIDKKTLFDFISTKTKLIP